MIRVLFHDSIIPDILLIFVVKIKKNIIDEKSSLSVKIISEKNSLELINRIHTSENYFQMLTNISMDLKFVILLIVYFFIPNQFTQLLAILITFDNCSFLLYIGYVVSRAGLSILWAPGKKNIWAP